MKRHYFNKLIISGSTYELYKYEEPIVVGSSKKRTAVKRRTKEEIMKEVKEDEILGFKRELISDFSLRRTRSKIVRLVNSNPDLETFITLTFKINLTELSEANKVFNRFIKRLRRKVPNLKYLAIPEFQDRGAVHYHLLANFEMRQDDLESIWDQGFVKINKVRHVDKVGLYVSKYLSKNLFDLRYFGMRKILASRNLVKPIVLTFIKEIKECFDKLKDNLKLLSESSYFSDWLGMIKYRLYGT